MGTFSNEFITVIYNLPKTKEAVSGFLNSYYDEVSPSGKVKRRMMWERFEAPYVKVTQHYVVGDEAEVYEFAYKLVSRCVLADVAPYFESDGQFFSYFQLMVKNTRINNSVKEGKQSFLLIGDLIRDDDATDEDYSNFEERVLGGGRVGKFDDGGLNDVIELIDSLGEPDLVLFGHLFIENGFSFDGMHGLCGFDLKKFKEVKKRFIAEIKKRYADGR